MSSRMCPTIVGLKLDRESILAIKRIKEGNAGMKRAEKILAFGVVANIFIKSSVPTAAFNITQTDWELFAESLSSFSEIQRNMIKIEAVVQIYRLQGDVKQKLFWEGWNSNTISYTKVHYSPLIG